MRDIQTSKVIVSVYRGTDEEANTASFKRVFDTLRSQGIQFRVVRGAYKGVPEESFLMYTTDSEQHQRHVAIGIDLAVGFKQETFLEVANDNAATLHRVSGSQYSIDRVGTWREVSKVEATSRDGYTCDVLTGRYFIVD